MSLAIAEILSALSGLSQLHKHPRIRSQLDQLLPHWQNLRPTSVSELTPRQWRRWQLLSQFWQTHGEALIQQASRRGQISPERAKDIWALGQNLAVPANANIIPAGLTACTALFITRSGQSDVYGTTCGLELRQLKYTDRFPPLHLSARFADAAILSSGHLALEATGLWLGKKLALEDAFPLWAEVAFPDHVRLMDESASLAFVGAVLQRLFEHEEPGQAFSGLVRRDTGQIEPVQGFDLPYGKLEAAFDAGVKNLFLPLGTPLQALPEAGIRLKKIHDRQFHYFFDLAPEDALIIDLVSDLDGLFAACFGGDKLKNLSRQLQNLPANTQNFQLSLPGLPAWRGLESRLLPLLPEALAEEFKALSQAFVQAHELTMAGLNHRPAWLECSQKLEAWHRQSLHFMGMYLLSLALLNAESRDQESLFQALRALPSPLPVAPLLALLRSGPFKRSLNQPEIAESLARLLAFVSSLSCENPENGPEAIWARFRFMLNSLNLPILFAPLSLDVQGSVWVSSEQTGKLPLALFKRPEQDNVSEDKSRQNKARQNKQFEFLLFDGMSEQTPYYRFLNREERQACPNACPNLSETPLEWIRHFPASLKSQGSKQSFALTEQLQVRVRLRNPGPLPMAEVQWTELLPQGLSSNPIQVSWKGPLAAGESVEIDYLLDIPQAGEYLYPEAQLQYRYQKGMPFAPAPMAAQTLEIRSIEPPQIVLQRKLTPFPPQTGAALTLSLTLNNHSSALAQALNWERDQLLPFGFESNAPLPFLPRQLAPFECKVLNLDLTARVPGLQVLPALHLHYSDLQGQTFTSDLPAESVEIAFHPYFSSEVQGQTLEKMAGLLRQGTVKGLYLWGPRGQGKRELLQSWNHELFCLELKCGEFNQGSAANVFYERLLSLALAQPSFASQDLSLLHRAILAQDPHTDIDAEQVFQAALRLLKDLGQIWPRVLLKIYDLESLSPSDLTFVKALIRQTDDCVFFCLTGSAMHLPETLSKLGLIELPLPPLGLDAIKCILAELFPNHHFPADLAQNLERVSAGNQFYLQETLVWLVQQQWLQFSPETGWNFTQTHSELPIPTKLEKMIQSDLESLPELSQILQLAAYLGASFELKDLAAILQKPAGQIQASLENALRKQILTESSYQQYQFSHPLYQEQLKRLAQDKASRIHLLLATYFEQQTGADPERCAHHFLASGKVDQALKACFLAGQSARRQGRLESAFGWYQKTHHLLSQYPAKQVEWIELYRELSQVALLSQDREQAEAYCMQSETLARESQNPLLIATCLIDKATLEEPSPALAILEQARVLAEQSGHQALLFRVYKALAERTAEIRAYSESQPLFYKALGHSVPQSLEMAELLETMSYAAIRAGQIQMAENDLLVSKQIYAQHQHASGLASVYNRLGAACFYQQEFKRARYYFGESKTYLEQTGNLLRLSHVNHNLGLLSETLRDYAQAHDIFSQNRALSQRLGDARIEGLALNQRASVALKMGELQAAHADLQQAQYLLQKAEDRRGLAYVDLNLGLYGLLSGDLGLAHSHLLTAQVAHSEVQDIMGQDLVTLRLGHFYWLSGQVEQAETHYAICKASREVLDAKQLDGLERVYHALGVVAFGRDELQAAYDYFKLAEGILLKTRELSHLAKVFHNLMRVALQRDQLDQALKLKRDRDMLIQIDPYHRSSYLLAETSLALILD
jgi:hypothetical protein